MPYSKVTRTDNISQRPTANHEGPNPVKSVVIRLSDKDGKKRFAINGNNSSKSYGSNPKTKWSYWFKYWNF